MLALRSIMGWRDDVNDDDDMETTARSFFGNQSMSG